MDNRGKERGKRGIKMRERQEECKKQEKLTYLASETLKEKKRGPLYLNETDFQNFLQLGFNWLNPMY